MYILLKDAMEIVLDSTKKKYLKQKLRKIIKIRKIKRNIQKQLKIIKKIIKKIKIIC